jgi:hypothetical protein
MQAVLQLPKEACVAPFEHEGNAALEILVGATHTGKQPESVKFSCPSLQIPSRAIPLAG